MTFCILFFVCLFFVCFHKKDNMKRNYVIFFDEVGLTEPSRDPLKGLFFYHFYLFKFFYSFLFFFIFVFDLFLIFLIFIFIE
jgi:hypothetical protein